MKQSSIEWLMEQMQDKQPNWLYVIDTREYVQKLWEQAKEMHKEEIVDANFYGQRLHAKSVTNTMMEDNAYGYYNETFNTKEE
jgi:hypothetical protein